MHERQGCVQNGAIHARAHSKWKRPEFGSSLTQLALTNCRTGSVPPQKPQGLQSLSCGNNAITELPGSIKGLVWGLVSCYSHGLVIVIKDERIAISFAILYSILTGMIAACCSSQVSLQKLTLSSNKLSAPEPILQRDQGMPKACNKPSDHRTLQISWGFPSLFTFRSFGHHQDVLLKCIAVMDSEFSSQSAFEDSYCRFRGFGHLMTGDIKNSDFDGCSQTMHFQPSL